jgi:hypothetical protein
MIEGVGIRTQSGHAGGAMESRDYAAIVELVLTFIEVLLELLF